jgi:hypothetical protein
VYAMLARLIGFVILIVLALLIYVYRHHIQKWYERFHQDVECAPLRRKLLILVRQDTAERLIALAKKKNPGKSERWYLEKVIYDLQRRR